MKERNKLNGFKASNTWAKKWCRYQGGLTGSNLHDEAGSVDKDKILENIAELKDQIAQYHPENVYNMDEIGLFYKLLPLWCYVKKYFLGTLVTCFLRM